MPRAPRLPPAALVGLLLAALTAGADEAKYDLRGPAPKKGQKITQKVSLKLKDGKATFDDGNDTVTLDTALTGSGEQELEVLAVDGRDVTKARLKVVQMDSEITFTVAGKEKTTKEKKALAGETVLLEKAKGKWRKELVGGKATDKQAKELEELDAPADEGLIYPDKKVAKGHKWDVAPEQVTKLLGGNVTGVTGKAKGHFRAVEKVNGEECAVIDLELDLKGTHAAGKQTTLEMKGKATVHRSLKTGVDLKTKAEGTMRMRGKTEEGGKTVETDVRGKVTYEVAATVK